MHGPGYAPPQPPSPSSGTQITLRVVFVALAVLSCGFFAWPSMLRLALVTRRTLDWALLFLSMVHISVVTTLIALDPGDEEFTSTGNTGMWLMISGMVITIAYYLYADIRHFSASRAMAYAQTTGGYVQPQVGYGYPGPQPFPPTPPVPQPPVQHQPVQPQPQQPAQPQRPARIDQVRAELDELSDYLRKHEDGR